MKISTKGLYAMEALLCLALESNQEKPVSTREIAQIIEQSEGYLEQLFIPLGKAGIIAGVRGSRGGYMLGKPLSGITVGEVLRTVEGTLQPVFCVTPNLCNEQDSCKSRPLWSGLFERFTELTDSITLLDITRAYATMDFSLPEQTQKPVRPPKKAILTPPALEYTI
jgi:Rrf2 family protein